MLLKSASESWLFVLTFQEDVKKQCTEKERLINELRQELSNRDYQIEDLVNSIHLQQQQKDVTTHNLRMQISELHQRLQQASKAEVINILHWL